MDDKRIETGAALLRAAYAFWSACQEEGQYGAVQWLEGSAGELIVFTRGEYRQQIMSNIHTLPNSDKIHYFGEAMPTEDDEA